MNVVGRHATRSSAATAAIFGQNYRQYAADGLLDASTQNTSFLNLSSSQDFGYYGGSRGGGPRMMTTELSPGILDLNSFDTELLTEIQGSSQFEAYSFQQPVRGKMFDDVGSFAAENKAGNKPRGLPDNNLLKGVFGSLPENPRERTNSVAKIKVVVRKRPLNKKEIAKREQDIITIDHSNALTVHETKLKVDLTEYVEKHDFVFDAVLNEDVSNDEVYSETVEAIIPLIFQKTKATCFAYGQTGSGKTYTMQPLPLRASRDILRLMYFTYKNQGFQLFVSFFEIYGGKVFDLLNDRKKLCMREDGKQQVCIVGLQEYKVFDVEEIKELIEKGNATRSVGITGANEESSRSHGILQLAIKKTPDGNETKPARPMGKLSFIDLAGSERGADTTDNDKQTRMEGADINRSLLALKECIRALDNDHGHIPFRGSKLTEVLRDSFVGDSRTVMISCISPSSGSCEHTLNTLRYADRVKSLSKGSISKRDLLASSSLRDSGSLSLSSFLQSEPTFENITDIPAERNRFGWSRQNTRDQSTLLPPIERVPSGRMDENYSRLQRIGQNDTEDDIGHSRGTYEQPQLPYVTRSKSYKSLASDEWRKSETQTRLRDLPPMEANKTFSEDDLDVLLKEEEELVSAHRSQVEETIGIVREEMSLLFEVEKPGNQVDDYISKLNSILSQKSAAILQLQSQLSRFQKRLNECNVLVLSRD